MDTFDKVMLIIVLILLTMLLSITLHFASTNSKNLDCIMEHMGIEKCLCSRECE